MTNKVWYPIKPNQPNNASNAGAMGNVEYSFIGIALRAILTQVIASDWVLSIGQILCTFAKLNC